MPKRLSDIEREFIKKRLKEEAMRCLVTFGVKKTTVDELVKRVNIPKGTFYLFYESKELLLYDAIMELHNEMQERLISGLADFSEGITEERLTDFLFRVYQEIYDTGLMPIVVNGEMEYLMRKLPEDMLKEHLVYDDNSIKQLFAFISPGNKDIEIYSGAFRAVFMTMLFRREIGEQIYDDVVRLIIRGIVLQIIV